MRPARWPDNLWSAPAFWNPGRTTSTRRCILRAGGPGSSDRRDRSRAGQKRTASTKELERGDWSRSSTHAASRSEVFPLRVRANDETRLADGSEDD